MRAELAASGELFDIGYEPRMARVHERNARRLLRTIDSVGWPGTDLVGPDGAEAAWIIPGEVEDPQQLGERRRAVGLPPLAEQMEAARSRATSEGDRPPADYEAYARARDEWAASVGWRAD